MKNTAYMITRKDDSFNGVIKNIDENTVVILWEDDSEEQMSNAELKEFIESDDYDIEEVELTEDTPAQDSIKMHTSPDASGGEADGNPKTKIDWIRAIIGNLADLDLKTLSGLQDQVLSLVGGEGERAGLGNVVGKNQASVNMKPSAAEGKGAWSGMESIVPTLQKEEQDVIFGETDLTEDAKMKMTTLFETAVSIRLVEETVKIEEAYEAKLNEAIERVSASMTETINDYLNHVVNEWISENQVAIESTLRSELTNDFLLSLKGLFIEHFIDIPEDKVDILEAVVEENEKLKEDLNKQINEAIEVQKTIKAMKKAEIVSESLLSLTLPQRGKLKKLSETIEFENEKLFTEKLNIVKKGFINEKNTTSEVITESFDSDPKDDVVSNPTIAAMGKSIF